MRARSETSERSAELVFDLTSAELAESVCAALKPETRSAVTSRFTVEVAVEGARLSVRIRAHDTAALRAAVNAYGRWVNCAYKILTMLDEPAR